MLPGFKVYKRLLLYYRSVWSRHAVEDELSSSLLACPEAAIGVTGM
jgi:hypothetical protein